MHVSNHIDLHVLSEFMAIYMTSSCISKISSAYQAALGGLAGLPRGTGGGAQPAGLARAQQAALGAAHALERRVESEGLGCLAL